MWPAKCVIRVIDASSKLPVPNLVLFIQVLVARKNNYSLGPLVTDGLGRVTLAKADVDRAISEAMRESPMDYSSEISSCTGDLLIMVDDQEALEKRIERIATFYPDEAARLRSLAENRVNREVRSLRQTERVAAEIEIRVERKVAPRS